MADRLEEGDPADDVRLEVAGRIPDRFGDDRLRAAVEDRLDPRLPQEPGHRGEVGVGDRREARVGVRTTPVPGREVVDDRHFVTGRDEVLDRDRADVAGAARDEHAPHHRPTVVFGHDYLSIPLSVSRTASITRTTSSCPTMTFRTSVRIC